MEIKAEIKTKDPEKGLAGRDVRYCLNADDFGMNPGKTAAIDDAFLKGWVQTASLVVNMPGFEEAVALADEHGYKDKVGFHLNLTDGFPLTDAVRKTPLCKADGSFAKRTNLEIQKRCFLPHHIRAIRKECEAQIKRFRDSGFDSKHIDSHRWIFWNLPVWYAVKPLLNKYGFITTRTMNGHFRDSYSGRLAKCYCFVYKKMLRVLKERTDWSGRMGDFLKALNEGTAINGKLAEIYVHPKYIDGVSMDILYYKDEKRPLDEVIGIARTFGEPTEVQHNRE